MKTKAVNDMYLCAAFLSYRVELKEIDKENPKRQVFYFVDKPVQVWKLLENNMVTRMEFVDLDQVEILFRSKKLMFLPDYHNFIRDTKSMIHAK